MHPLPKNSDFPGGSDGKASAYNVGDPGSMPASGRSPGERNHRVFLRTQKNPPSVAVVL